MTGVIIIGFRARPSISISIKWQCFEVPPRRAADPLSSSQPPSDWSRGPPSQAGRHQMSQHFVRDSTPNAPGRRECWSFISPPPGHLPQMHNAKQSGRPLKKTRISAAIALLSMGVGIWEWGLGYTQGEVKSPNLWSLYDRQVNKTWISVVKWWRLIVFFKLSNWLSSLKKMSVWSLSC